MAAELAGDRSGIRRDVDGVLAQRRERDDIKGALVRGCEHDVGGCAILVRSQPVRGGYAPAVTGHEPGEAVLLQRGAEIVADAPLVLEKLGRDHRADRVTPPVLGAGAAAPVAVEPGERIDPTRLELTAENIAIAHAGKYPRVRT
jgi:hypothetical protein